MSMKFSQVRHWAAWGGLAAFTSMAAQADPIGYTAWDVSGSDKLLRINLATGNGTVIGTNLGYSDVDGLAFDGAGGLWGVDDNTNQLLSIDVNTGAATAVGAFGTGYNDMGLAWGGGTMYMTSENVSGGHLYSVNLGNGATSLIGNFAAGLNVRSLGYTGGTLYGWSNQDTLLTINTSNAATSVVGDFNFPSFTIGQDGMDADPQTGQLWAIAEVEGRTYTLNSGNGLATVVASSLSCNGGSCSAGGFNSLAISVPEPESLPLSLAGLLAVAGIGARRRRIR